MNTFLSLGITNEFIMPLPFVGVQRIEPQLSRDEHECAERGLR